MKATQTETASAIAIPRPEMYVALSEEPPFKGLHYFDMQDSDLYFGRELLVAELVKQITGMLDTRRTGQAHGRFLSVIGASGSGKSSLVRAGLVPALQHKTVLAAGVTPPPGSNQWPLHIITPTAHPLKALAIGLTRNNPVVSATASLLEGMERDHRYLDLFISKEVAQLPDQGGQPKRFLLVVDQFEELFTLCRDRNQRRAFIENLLYAAGIQAEGEEEDGPAVVVLTLRADFYGHCAEVDSLRRALEAHQKYIGPMKKEELRAAIEQPALHHGWNFEPGLVETLLQDVNDAPGALPLLSHALLETWKRRNGRTLTMNGYLAAGRVQGAIAHTAESVYRKELTAEQQPIARNLFMRLTELGEGAQDTRRRVALRELVPPGGQGPLVRTVINTLARARLISTTEDSVEVAHEALIREWPTLRDWLAENREGLRIHRRLTEATQEWEKLRRDPGALYRGVLLQQTVEWARFHEEELNQGEHEFLRQSHTTMLAAEEEKERTRRQALEQQRALAREAEARHRAEHQRARAEHQRAQEAMARADAQGRAASRLRWLLGAMGALLCLAVIAWALIQLQAFRLTQQATQLQEQTEQLKTQQGQLEGALGEAQRQTQIAQDEKGRADQKTDEAIANAEIAAFQERRARAGEIGGQARSRMQSSGLADDTTLLLARDAVLTTLMVDGYVAPIADTALRQAIDMALPATVLPRNAHRGVVNQAIYSLDGGQIVSVGADGTVRIWRSDGNASNLAWENNLKAHTDAVSAVAVSGDGRIASAGLDGTIRLWSSDTYEVQQVIDGHEGTFADDTVFAVAFNPVGDRVVSGGQDSTVRLWDATTGAPLLVMKGHGDDVLTVGFSPNGDRIVSAGVDKSVRVWSVVDGSEMVSVPYSKTVRAVAFSPDGAQIVSGDDDGAVLLWNSSQPAADLRIIQEKGGRPVLAVAFSPTGDKIASGQENGMVRLWQVETGQSLPFTLPFTLTGHVGAVRSVRFSPDGRQVLTSGDDATIRIWDAESGQLLNPPNRHAGGINSMRISPDGALLVTAGADGTVRIWDAEREQMIGTLTGHVGAVNFATFSRDGTYIVSTGVDRTARLWNSASGELQQTFAVYTNTVAADMSPDGTRLVAGQGDGSLAVWDVTNGQPITQLVGHVGPVYSVLYSPDGRRLASGGDDGTIRLWDAISGQPLLPAIPAHNLRVFSLAFNANGSELVSASWDRNIRFWDVETGTQIPTPAFKGHTDGLLSVALHQDGLHFASAGSTNDRNVLVWSRESSQPVFRLEGHIGPVTAVLFRNDGKIVSASQDGTMRIWDVNRQLPARILEGHDSSVRSVVYTPDEAAIVSASQDGRVRFWDVRTGQSAAPLEVGKKQLFSINFRPDGKRFVVSGQEKFASVFELTTATAIPVSITASLVYTLPDHPDEVFSVAYSHDGNLIASGCKDGSIRLWQAQEEGATLITLLGDDENPGHSKHVRSLVFSQNDQWLLSASDDKTFILWEIASKTPRVFKGHVDAVRSAFFSPDELRIVSASQDNTVRIWDVASGELLHTLDKHTGPVYWAIYSPDGAYIASGSRDQTVRIWRANDGALLRTMEGHASFVNTLAYSRDGRRIISGSTDWAVRIWEADITKILSDLEANIQRPSQLLDDAERRLYGVK